jgi:hypothetical protein
MTLTPCMDQPIRSDGDHEEVDVDDDGDDGGFN